MLFHPSADQKLEAISAQLDLWDEAADRFRAAAIAGRRGEAPGEATVAAAEETHDELMSLLDDIGRALEMIPAGRAEFTTLLHAQSRAVALTESVTSSLELLDRCRPVAVAEPTVIGRSAELKAAE